jgi:hypothetical protein
MDIINSSGAVLAGLDSSDWISLGTAVILLVTAIILFFYTRYTYRQWKESKAQTDLLQTPYLQLLFNNEIKISKFSLRNAGKGVATKIAIERWTPPDRELEVAFSPIELIEPGEEKIVRYKVLESGQGVTLRDMLIYSFGDYLPLKRQSPFVNEKPVCTFGISYEDIIGRKHYYDIVPDEGGYKMTRKKMR